MAEWTGLEPATPGVTGRYSNQLNYHSCFSMLSLATLQCASGSSIVPAGLWWVLRDLNPRHSPCKGDALPLS